MKKLLASLTVILLLIHCSQDSNSITGNNSEKHFTNNIYSEQTTIFQDLRESIPVEMSDPVAIAILDSGRSDEKCNVVYFNQNCQVAYEFKKFNDKWTKTSLVSDITCKALEKTESGSKSCELAELYSSIWFNNLIGTYWECSNVELTGDYYTPWVYTENINHPIPTPKSLKFIGGGQHVVDEKILDVSFIEWQCGAYGKNNPNPSDNTPIYWSKDNNDGECTNGNAWSTLLAAQYPSDTGYVDYTLWPDYVSLGFHVNVSSIYPSANISGPNQFPKGKTARFYVTVNGGFEPYYYQWWVKETDNNPYKNTNSQYIIAIDESGIRRPPTDVWVQASGDEICDYTCYLDFYIKCVVTDKNGNADTSNILFVDVTDDDVWPPRH